MKLAIGVFVTTLCWCGIFALQAKAADHTISLVSVDYPPYYGKNLKNNGFITEIIKAAYEESGYQITVKFKPWKRAFEETKVGKYDGLFTIWFREDRKKWFLYSSPLTPNFIGFYTRKKDKIAFSTLQDLKPFKIGVVRGYSNPPDFEKATYIQKKVANNDEQNLRKLILGSVDLVLIDKYLGAYLLNTNFADKKNDLQWIDPPLKVDNQYIAFSKKAANIEMKAHAFNNGLKIFLEKKMLKPVMEKHGFAYTQKDFPTP